MTRPVLFVHIMKTAGASFRQQMVANLGAEAVYPAAGVDGEVGSTAIEDANWSIERLRRMPDERRRSVRAVAGHFPWMVHDLLDPDPFTLALVREPVARTVSYLRQSQRLQPQHEGLSLEEIYEDPFVFRCFVENHQAKVFALRAEDEPESYMDVLTVDERRLVAAVDALGQVDVLGLTEDYGAFVDRACRRLSWRRHDVADRHVRGTRARISRSFRRRIEQDNAADLELYEAARRLVGERGGG